MRIFIKVKSRAKEEFVKKVDEKHFIVAVKEPPVKGKANQAVIEALAEYFDVKRSRVSIVAGHTSKQKIIDIVL